ncbi:MAG: pyrroline-5-carboxylate reductase [Candidatus Omnitrophica bacterium]|nr:pyrroline-5-carboxylate reductase [Candidatus Omnitrophota bacterium]
MKTKLRVGIIGGGNMGAAIIAGIHASYQVSVCDPDQEKIKFLRKKYGVTSGDLADVISASDRIILAVKPQMMAEVLTAVKPYANQRKLFVSIAAGVTAAFIEKQLGKGQRVVRTMPNLPAQVGQGMTAVSAGRNATVADVKTTCQLFDKIGRTVVVEEKMMDAVTAVSGSGPAYLFLFVECLLAAAKNLKLSDAASRVLVTQTLKGSLALLESSGEDAAVLRERVTSKGGTTQAALEVFAQRGMQKIFTEALQAAAARAGELSQGHMTQDTGHKTPALTYK